MNIKNKPLFYLSVGILCLYFCFIFLSNYVMTENQIIESKAISEGIYIPFDTTDIERARTNFAVTFGFFVLYVLAAIPCIFHEEKRKKSLKTKK